MKFTIACLLPVALLCGCDQSSTPEGMRARHLEARGGVAALQAMKVIEREGTFTAQADPQAHGSYHTCIRYPDRVAVDIDAGPVQIHQVLGDHGAFECDALFSKCKLAGPEEAHELTLTAQQANREELEEHLPTDGSIVLLREDGRVVGYSYGSGEKFKASEFSPDTGLKRVVKSGERERHYSDWKDAGGVLFPMQIDDYDGGEKAVTVALTRATLSDKPSAWCLSRFAVASQDLP